MKEIKGNKDGLILMISLWILAIISLLCVSLAHRVVVDLKLAKFQKDRLQCLYIAKAAVQKAMNLLGQDETYGFDMLNESWSSGHDSNPGDEPIFKEIKIGKGFFSLRYIKDDSASEVVSYTYGMIDEERKININYASREVLVSLFTLMDAENPQSLAENIIYWRGDAPLGYEDQYYDSPTVPYSARQAPFRSIEELQFVKGFREDPQLTRSCERFLTLYTDYNAININTAPYPVLKAVFMGMGADKVRLGLSDKLVQNVIAFRNGVDSQEATGDDAAININQIKTVIAAGLHDIVEINWVANQVFPFTAKSNLFRIEVLAGLDSSKIKKQVTAILNRRDYPIRVVYWHEN
jgi:type II secretory pathway component PulK